MDLTNEKFQEIFPFPSPRAGQKELITKILSAYESGKKFVVLSAPTGVGKSCIGLAVANYFGNSYILTSQKSLQQQYYDTLQVPFVLGRKNYQCIQLPDRTCDIGKCLGKENKKCNVCPYGTAKAFCLNSPHSGLNYAYFLNLIQSPQKTFQKKILVCDEAHNLEEELLKIYTPKVDIFTIKNLALGSSSKDLPKPGTDMELDWLINTLLPKTKKELAFAQNQMNSFKDGKSESSKKIAKRFVWIRELLCKLEMINSVAERGEEIIITNTGEEITYRPLKANGIFGKTLLQEGDKFLFMSATIVNPSNFLYDLGIPKEEAEIIECDSPFPIENHPIYYSPAGSMSYKKKQETYPKLVKLVDKILNLYPNDKGIIHTVNYEIAEKIETALKFSKNSKRIIIPRGQNRQEQIDYFTKADFPFVLLSPSLQEGIDLKDDLARFCIICKVPYASLKDEWVIKRMKDNQNWYTTKTCSSLVQMTGRCVRTETDHADSYILDSDFEKLLRNGGGKILPKWWLLSLKEKYFTN